MIWGGGGSEDKEYENVNTLITQYVIYLFLPSHIFPLNIQKTFFCSGKEKNKATEYEKNLR